MCNPQNLKGQPLASCKLLHHSQLFQKNHASGGCAWRLLALGYPSGRGDTPMPRIPAEFPLRKASVREV